MTPPLVGDGRDSDAVGRVAGRLDQGWRWFLGAPDALVALLLVALVVFRSGVALGRSDIAAVRQITESFPTPVLDWRSNSVIGPALGHLVGVDANAHWFVLHGVVIVVLAMVVAVCTRRRFTGTGSRRIAATWLALSSLPPVVLQRVGSYDPYTALGAVLVVWGGGLVPATLGGVLLGLTSAEQGVLALLGAAGVALALRPASDGTPTAPGGAGLRGAVAGSPLLRQLLAGLAGLLVARALVLAWFAAEGADVPSRTSVAGDLLGDSLRNAAGSAGAGIYAWFGLAWAVLAAAWIIGRWSRTTGASVAAALLVPGALAWATTLDGTRVFVMVSLPAFLVLLAWLVDQLEVWPVAGRRLMERLTVAALVLAPIVPALIAEPSGAPYFVFPWGR